MKLQIVSPEAQLFNGEVESITVPGTSGSFQILNNHAPIVSSLVAGEVKIQGNIILDEQNKEKFSQHGNITYLNIKSGTVELRNNNIILLTE